jgi:hypothetical protein
MDYALGKDREAVRRDGYKLSKTRAAGVKEGSVPFGTFQGW